ncbi:eukaryotic translation initiation factor 3 subunit G [Tribolium castaneum]|uniref:Eukaryotic translation initiation factor 3 subunit G n=1 Tax=Tribolium castaneum TaxID=7070 RepID=D6X2C9_TRICA|nr:PREDICTED: eukaryotic translation initiation factor 3 subunit G [Tribolium castaneum]EFA10249.1 Eukaryotic translation initiation factor 3 subunit G-1-like Protein [Tribolium castaneum]|eukprot:XP_008197848.1 PREDICTED: eukaryotic translation initiation factor 3 subunit G [Tribolium castaneum]
MPVAEEVKSSWADEVELEGGSLPPPTEVYENGFKIVTEYAYNEDDKKMKIVRTYKIEKRVVSKSIAFRKTWKKFGECANDKPGPNPATTIVAEDVYMQYITSKEEDNKQEDDALEKLKALGDKNVVKCRTCSGDHWTSKCPWKDTMLAGGKVPDDKKGPAVPSGSDAGKAGGSKYIPPSLRDGAVRKSDNLNMARRDDATAIRITNLSESTTETDLEDLVKPFGPIQKLYLAKDKQAGYCKGFAYIHFKFKNDAAKAISMLNGHGYDHLILTVDWSKPHPN